MSSNKYVTLSLISRFLRKNLRQKPSRQSTVSSKKNSAWSMIFPPVKTEIKTSESGLLHTNRMSFSVEREDVLWITVEEKNGLLQKLCPVSYCHE